MSHDPVNNPEYYTFGKIEFMDVIEDWDCGFHDGNVIKYVMRHKRKGNPIQDLEKAKWYLERLIELLKKGSS